MPENQLNHVPTNALSSFFVIEFKHSMVGLTTKTQNTTNYTRVLGLRQTVAMAAEGGFNQVSCWQYTMSVCPISVI